MKKLILLTVATLSLLFLLGCNSKDSDKVTVSPENKTQDSMTQNGDIEPVVNPKADAEFNFIKFDLDIDYSGNKEFDVDYDNEPEGLEVEVKNDMNNTHQTGDEALSYLRPYFEKLTFDYGTPDVDVISEVLKVFELAEDYISFELEVRFVDGTEKEYQVVK